MVKETVSVIDGAVKIAVFASVDTIEPPVAAQVSGVAYVVLDLSRTAADRDRASSSPTFGGWIIRRLKSQSARPTRAIAWLMGRR